MNVKIIVRFLALSSVISCHAIASCQNGCYECVEEVWEEVDCSEIPPDASTERPPNNTTTTPRPTTTTTRRSTTTTRRTTRPPTTQKTTETPTDDSYKKCYCECKVGCKEFCRKVVVNPESKKQIVQLSKISEPVAQGRIESTHFHQRELVGKKSFGADSHETHGSHLKKVKSLLPKTDKYEKPPVESSPSSYNNIPQTSYYSNPPSQGGYASAYAGANSIGPVQSYVPIRLPQTQYYSAPAGPTYDFPIPFAGTYSKLAVASSPYSSPTPVQNSQIDTRISAGNPANYDDPIDAYLKDIISGNPVKNYQRHKAYAVAFR